MKPRFFACGCVGSVINRLPFKASPNCRLVPESRRAVLPLQFPASPLPEQIHQFHPAHDQSDLALLALAGH
ncbi:hypothetical protein [Noviherbaspirillum soli]|uniref:hypothetical protein n=1 Tax=Noviherbaspirillum soli TaxID=1064518 RepID=UPI00188D6213|nr:hypothetical protein [Noviherbaspirillum soli]